MIKKYTAIERKEYLVKWSDSGLSGSQFCKENNIRPTTFYGWTNSERKKRNKKEAEFVRLPVMVKPEQSTSEIVLEYGSWKIKLASGFNPEDLKSIIEVLGCNHVS